MANTTNFNWETPDDTDLVKDGAAAIRTLGSAIDTSLVDLKGGTTGQILSKATNTDMDFTWITNDVGDITEVVASAPLTGGGASGSVTVGIQDGTTAQKGAIQLEDSTSSTSTTKAATPNSVKSAYDLANAAIAKSLVDAKGDLIVGTANDTPARLAVSATNGHVLTVDSNETAGIKWAAAAAGGSLTLLSTTTLSGASTTISGISGSYKNLYVEVENLSNASAANQLFCIPNNSTNKMTYVNSSTNGTGSGLAGYRYQDDTNINMTYNIKTFGNTNNFWSFNFYNYASSATRKTFNMIGGYVTSGGNETTNANGYYNEDTAISSLVFTHNGGNWAGGTVRIYGVN